MCSYRLTLAVMNGHQPTPVRHRTMSVRADGPLEAARRAEDLCNVLLDRTSGSELWAQTTASSAWTSRSRITPRTRLPPRCRPWRRFWRCDPPPCPSSVPSRRRRVLFPPPVQPLISPLKEFPCPLD
jgi:hypothetical protein